MADYKKLYFMLFNGISKTIEELQKIQQECEQMYIEQGQQPPVKLANTNKINRDKK